MRQTASPKKLQQLQYDIIYRPPANRPGARSPDTGLLIPGRSQKLLTPEDHNALISSTIDVARQLLWLRLPRMCSL
jgi:hypothetical protein